MLERAISRAEWNVLHMRTYEEALATMVSVLVPVIVCDENAAGGHWKEVIKSIISSPHPAPVLVASKSHDWRLWVDIIDSGGFDLISKPFDGATAGEKLELAFGHWKHGRTRRTWDHFFSR
jgi:DNA-binding NtrC family response regulator